MENIEFSLDNQAIALCKYNINYESGKMDDFIKTLNFLGLDIAKTQDGYRVNGEDCQ